MRYARILVFLALGLAPVAAAAQTVSEKQGQGGVGYCTVEVLSAQQPDSTSARPNETPTFSSAEILDLTFAVEVRQSVVAKTESTLEILVYTPRGHLYERREAPIAEPEREPGYRRVAGYPLPVPERPLRPAGGSGADALWRAEVDLPVAGTSIVRDALYGDWSVEVSLHTRRKKDQRVVSCGKRQSFRLTS